jgi:hypothetical protein
MATDKRTCGCADTYFHTCRPDDALAAGRHPKWQRVEPGHVIPAGQPYRIEWSDATADKLLASERLTDHNILALQMGSWFVDSSWRPPLVLPTTPGSVIEATRHGSKHLWWMTKSGKVWANDIYQLSEDGSDLTVHRILFDAGAEA